MACLPRFSVPGQPQYVIVRGNNRTAIFCADTDRHFYLDKLQVGLRHP
jgi:putative transposase